MIGMEVDHCQIVSNGLNQTAPAGEQVMASMAVLSERLERIKALGGAFAGISLSSEAESLGQWTSMAASAPVVS